MMNIKDRFLRFTYNDENSEDYGLFYENTGEDITFPFSQNISQKTISPIYQNTSFWVGGSRDAKTIQLDVAGDKKQMNDMQKIFRWLDNSKPGKIRFDFEDNFELDVVITKISSPRLIPYEFPNGLIEMITRFSIEFQTINDHTLTAVDPVSFKFLDQDPVVEDVSEMLPIVQEANQNGVRVLTNWNRAKQYLKLSTNGQNVEILFDGKLAYSYQNATDIIVNIDTSIGSMESRGELTEISYPKSIIKNNGPRAIEPGLVIEGEIEVIQEGNLSRVKYNSKMIEATPGSYSLAIMPTITKKSETGYLSRRKGDVTTGLYLRDGIYAVKPKVYVGYLENSDFLFATQGDLPTGKYEIKIARNVNVEIKNAKDSLAIWQYKKDV